MASDRASGTTDAGTQYCRKAGEQIAIEVQLAHKSRDSSGDTMSYLTDTYDGVWVFAHAGGPSLAIERALGELNPDKAKRVRLLPLESE